MFYIVYLFKGLHLGKLIDWNVGRCQQIVFKVQVTDWMPEEIMYKVDLVSQVVLYFFFSIQCQVKLKELYTKQRFKKSHLLVNFTDQNSLRKLQTTT